MKGTERSVRRNRRQRDAIRNNRECTRKPGPLFGKLGFELLSVAADEKHVQKRHVIRKRAGPEVAQLDADVFGFSGEQ